MLRDFIVMKLWIASGFENLASNYYNSLTTHANPFNNCGRPNLKNADPGQ